MTEWVYKKSYPQFYVDKNDMLIILIDMWITKLNEYDHKVECDDNSCVIRYSRSGGTMGLLRYSYILGWGKRLKQDIVIIKEMDINNLIGDIMVNENLTEEMAEYITTIIRMDATQRVKEYLKSLGNND